MEYRPRYSQPFTLEEARQLAVPIITEEISRLQNSLAHLDRTQRELEDALTTTPGDTDLEQAFEENEIVIGSQKERITILRMVLVEKGVPMSAHYDLQPPARVSQNAPGIGTAPAADGTHSVNSLTTNDTAASLADGSTGDSEDRGVYL
ncbi:hypothetical protein BV20DRAFT_984383 [Pilatotrama ljubarskyi]|nr:hypothetical protein BV20DRAFT_984383 [Pilatotrama ljubarskyi]